MGWIAFLEMIKKNNNENRYNQVLDHHNFCTILFIAWFHEFNNNISRINPYFSSTYPWQRYSSSRCYVVDPTCSDKLHFKSANNGLCLSGALIAITHCYHTSSWSLSANETCALIGAKPISKILEVTSNIIGARHKFKGRSCPTCAYIKIVC